MKSDYFTSPEFFLILAVVPLLIGIFKGLYSIYNNKSWLSNRKKSDINTIQHTLENCKLSTLERSSLNESLTTAKFEQLYGSRFNRHQRQKVLRSQKISSGNLTYHDFRKAKNNILLEDDNINFHKPPVFSYKIWAYIQKGSCFLLLLYSFLFSGLYLYKFIEKIAGVDKNFNGFLGLDDYFIIFTILVYIGLAVFLNELHLQTKATIKIKKYLNQVKPLTVSPDLDIIYFSSPWELNFKSVEVGSSQSYLEIQKMTKHSRQLITDVAKNIK